MLFNTSIIVVLARPRHASRVKGPLVEWNSFRELPFSLFSIGIFLTLWGIYFAYFYVCTASLRPAKAHNNKLARSHVHIDYHLRKGGYPCLVFNIAHATHSPERSWNSRQIDTGVDRRQVLRRVQYIDSIRSRRRHPSVLLDQRLELWRIHRICGCLRPSLKRCANPVSVHTIQSHNRFEQNGRPSGYGLHDC